LIKARPHAYHPPALRVNRPSGRNGEGGAMRVLDRFEVNSDTVSCDGGGGVDGHPVVYLRIGPGGAIICPYCSREFVLRRDAAGRAGH